jgi:hypothetical protein
MKPALVIVVLASLLVLAGGCASTSSVPLQGAGDPKQFAVFRHPTTGDVQRCQRAEWGWSKGLWDVLAFDKCKSTLEAQGYRRDPPAPAGED